MGYSLTIGEAEMRVPSAEEVRERWCSPHIRVIAKGAVSDDAPTFPGDELTSNSSSRSPSYSGWHDFCRETGLTELFYSEESGLLREHPGCVVLTSDHLTEIAAALDRYRTMHPGARPGWREHIDGGDWLRGPFKPETEGLDGNLARLIWLEWWTRWALANCKVPALWNT